MLFRSSSSSMMPPVIQVQSPPFERSNSAYASPWLSPSTGHLSHNTSPVKQPKSPTPIYTSNDKGPFPTPIRLSNPHSRSVRPLGPRSLLQCKCKADLGGFSRPSTWLCLALFAACFAVFFFETQRANAWASQGSRVSVHLYGSSHHHFHENELTPVSALTSADPSHPQRRNATASPYERYLSPSMVEQMQQDEIEDRGLLGHLHGMIRGQWITLKGGIASDPNGNPIGRIGAKMSEGELKESMTSDQWEAYLKRNEEMNSKGYREQVVAEAEVQRAAEEEQRKAEVTSKYQAVTDELTAKLENSTARSKREEVSHLGEEFQKMREMQREAEAQRQAMTAALQERKAKFDRANHITPSKRDAKSATHTPGSDKDKHGGSRDVSIQGRGAQPSHRGSDHSSHADKGEKEADKKGGASSTARKDAKEAAKEGRRELGHSAGKAATGGKAEVADSAGKAAAGGRAEAAHGREGEAPAEVEAQADVEARARGGGGGGVGGAKQNDLEHVLTNVIWSIVNTTTRGAAEIAIATGLDQLAHGEEKGAAGEEPKEIDIVAEMDNETLELLQSIKRNRKNFVFEGRNKVREISTGLKWERIGNHWVMLDPEVDEEVEEELSKAEMEAHNTKSFAEWEKDNKRKEREARYHPPGSSQPIKGKAAAPTRDVSKTTKRKP